MRTKNKVKVPKRQKEEMSKVTEEEVIHECWRRGTLIPLYRPQQKMIEKAWMLRPKYQDGTQEKKFVANCSRQIGKTYWAVCKSIEKALKKESARCIYASAYKTDVSELVIPTFQKILDTAPKEIREEIKFNINQSKFYFPNGSTIKIIGMDKNSNALRGNTLDLVIFEEAGFIDNLQYCLNSIVIPTMRLVPDGWIIFISTPSKTPDHYFKKLCEQADAGGYYIKMPITEVPGMTEAKIRSYKRELQNESEINDDTTWLREYMCEFVTSAEQAVVPEWRLKRDKILVNQTEFPPYYVPQVVGDMGLKDMTFFLFGFYDFKRNKLVIVDEWYTRRQTTEFVSKKVFEKEQEIFGKKLESRIADGFAQVLHDMTNIYGFHCNHPRKSDLEAMVNDLRIAIKGERIEIDKRCEKLIEHIGGALWKNRNRKEWERTESHHYDGLAALMYFWGEMDKRNPYPDNYGFENKSNDTYFVQSKEKQTTNYEPRVNREKIIDRMADDLCNLFGDDD